MQRITRQQPLQPLERRVRAPRQEVMFSGELDGLALQRIHAQPLVASELAVSQILERSAPPESQRGGGVVAGYPIGELLPSMIEQLSRATDINVLRVEPELIARRSRDDSRVLSLDAQRAAKLGDLDLQELDRAQRRVRAPQRIDQLIAADRGLGA